MALFSSLFKRNTLFFPGWVILANSNIILINYKNLNSPGVITFKLEKGIYDIKVKYIDLPIVVFSKWLSLISMLILVIYLFVSEKFLRQFPKP